MYTKGENSDMAKKEVVSIRVSAEFKNKLENEAKLNDVTVSEYILNTLHTPEKIKRNYDAKIEELIKSYETKIKELEQEIKSISESNAAETDKLIAGYEVKIKEIENNLKDSVEENKKLVEALQTEQTIFAEQQKLLSQQQQLQLFTQRQVEQLQQEKQLLLETKEKNKKWWQVWR